MSSLSGIDHLHMKTIHYDHNLFEAERGHLQDLIGRDLCGIGSDTVSIDPSHPELWDFHKWIELTNWNDNTILRLEYSYDETYSGNDFIELRIESIERERRALNASVSYGGASMFTVKRIETYGYEWDCLTENVFGNIQNEALISKEQYHEKVTIENSMLIYGANGKRIWIECQHSTLDLIVTMDEVYIERRLSESMPESNARMNLKHIFQ